MHSKTTKPVDVYAPASVVPTEDFCQCGTPWCLIYVEKWLVRVQCLNGHSQAEHLLTRTRLDQVERQMNVLRTFTIRAILESVVLRKKNLEDKSPSAYITYAAEEELLQRNIQEEAEKDLHEVPTTEFSNVYKFRSEIESSFSENRLRRKLRKENALAFRRSNKHPYHSDPDTDW